VTCFYANLDPKSGTLRYANAAHDLPSLWNGADKAEKLRARGMPFGLMPEMSYEEIEAILREKEGVFFYSDGLVEAHDPYYEMFGTGCSASRGFGIPCAWLSGCLRGSVAPRSAPC
jgi:serine phosphatase RsbU (regulator of sigma subunit)